MPDQQHAIIRIKDATTVTVNGEELPYARQTKAVIQNERGQRALYLQLGNGNHAFIHTSTRI